MAIEVTPLTPVFAGRMTGIDARRTLAPEEVAAVDAGMARYAVLVLPGQDITDEQQIAFSRNFGPLQNGANATQRRPELRLDPAFADVSNIGKDGTRLARDDRRRMASLGNRLWHSDASFRVIPARYSLLSGRIVVTDGGNTEFADMRAAYDALDARTKAEIEDLICEHSQIFSREQLGFTEYLPDERAMMAPVRHRLVRTHPTSHAKSLFLSAHIGGIVGWPAPEARAFIRDLAEHATQPPFVYAHKWTQHDLVIWDNRTTMHRVRRYDDLNTIRDLRRTTTKSDGPTAEQVAA
ncbi:MAG: TauD/TfdA family dioxygenase [Reyranella sp.]|uniref:TauD/TfdA dioxygenase family protein n=1 Tax=Reyranella sp. TaxID=1929291 RepID=UPI001AC4778A|nr:TauD/TfdA family dioxygenase [Reyranella sp.]MBN9090754.1 TauD/TfdA family dioxygenase [Reyranella sp.]